MLIRTWICLIEDIKVYLDVTFAVLYILNGGRERRIHGHFVILDFDIWYYTLVDVFLCCFETGQQDSKVL